MPDIEPAHSIVRRLTVSFMSFGFIFKLGKVKKWRIVTIFAGSQTILLALNREKKKSNLNY